MKHNQKGFGAVEGLLIFLLIGILGGVGWYVWHSQKNANKSYNNASAALGSTVAANGTKSNTAQPVALAAYTDPAKAYTIFYPKSWTVKEVQDNGLGLAPVLDSTQTRFTPSNLPTGAGNNTWVGISSYKTSDTAIALDARSATQSQKINGYEALYYQAVVPATKGSNGAAGGMGYTDDYYAVTNNGTTLVFYFREKQDGNGISTTFDASSIVPAYTALVKSVKFK